jgi:hypothetical protein
MFNGIPDFSQSIEMMQSMWANAAKTTGDGSNPSFNFPNMSAMNPFGIPMVDMEELDKRIKDLKSVEGWLTLNLNILQTTIQGLEVQRATLATLHGIAESMKSSGISPDETPKHESNEARTTKPSDFAGAGGKLAQELMEQMSKSMTSMMSAFPATTNSNVQNPAKKTPGRKKTTVAKTSKPRARRPRA